MVVNGLLGKGYKRLGQPRLPYLFTSATSVVLVQAAYEQAIKRLYEL